jgi:hypothetical protein
MEPSKLAEALSKAQAEMKNAVLNKTNPHFRSKYADLAAVRDATLPALNKYGLALTQCMIIRDTALILRTVLSHASGETMTSEYPLPNVPDKPQIMGSAQTYARRYCWAAMCGIAAEEDDDGEAAHANGNGMAKTSAAISGPIASLAPKDDQIGMLSIPWFDAQGEEMRKIRGAEAYLGELYEAVKALPKMFDANEDRLAWLEREYGTAKVGKKGKTVAQAARDIRLLYDAKTGAHV